MATSPEVQRLQTEMVEVEREVGEYTTVKESTVNLLDSLAQIGRDNIDNKAALTALFDAMSSKRGVIDMNSTQLAEAVARSTPAASEPTPAPPTE